MVADAVFFDLSSSDEDEEDHNQNRNVSTDSTGLTVLSKVCNLHVEDDDVVIIDKPTSNDKVKRDKPKVIRSVMDDDECCMLDTDPGATETIECTPPLDSDDLVMTGEKGPVACRDFPHARYLCVHFPFKTTPHANFCSQCHCYVCDSLAPCSLWGDGNSANDHCHASEESPWKTLRKIAKCRPVACSRATSIPAATATAQPAIVIPSLNGIANPTGVSKFVTVSSMLQTHGASPISPVVAPIPAGLGIPQRATARVYSPGLVISLRGGKGRGKPSQPQHHLGVARLPKPHRSSSTVVSALSGNNTTRPLPRSTSAPSSGRIIGDSTPAQLPRTLQIPQAPQHPQFTPYLSPVPLYTPAALNTVPDRTMSPPVNFPLAVGNSNAGAPYYYPFPAPPLPNSPPPYIPPPPSPCAYTSQPPAAYNNNYPSPDPVTYDHYPMPGQFSGTEFANTSVAELVTSDSRYVPAALSDLQVKQYDLNQGSSQSSPSSSYAAAAANYAPSELYVAQPGYRNCPASCVDNYPGGTGSGGGGPIVADMNLAGPIIATEGWAADVADSLFDTFGTTGVGPDSSHHLSGVTSLEKVLEQMAGDDYLWEQFPCW